MRVIGHLGLDWDGPRLPPDHLGAACEVLACAIGREEKVLVDELCERYLLPWCDAARSRLVDEDRVVGRLPEHFEADLRSAADRGEIGAIQDYEGAARHLLNMTTGICTAALHQRQLYKRDFLVQEVEYLIERLIT